MFFHFFQSLKAFLINTFAILMMLAKMDNLGLLKIKVFWNKGYDIIIFVHDVTNKILSSDRNYIVDVVIWPKFDNSSISMREVKTLTFKDLTRKNNLSEGWPWFKFNNVGLTPGMALKFYTNMVKELKLKVRKFWELIPMFVDVVREILVGVGGEGFGFFGLLLEYG